MPARMMTVVFALMLGASSARAQGEEPSPPPLVSGDPADFGSEQPRPPPYEQQPPHYQPPPPEPARQPQREVRSSRSKHFLGLASLGIGVLGNQVGCVVANARAEIDIWRLGFLLGYTSITSMENLAVHVFDGMAGIAFFSSDELTLRALGGVSIMSAQDSMAIGPVVGANLRSMWGRIGLDGAAMLTFLPFRQLEFRATLVIAWAIFEAHLGWQLRMVDATRAGTLGTLFSSSPSFNGPLIAVGVSL